MLHRLAVLVGILAAALAVAGPAQAKKKHRKPHKPAPAAAAPAWAGRSYSGAYPGGTITFVAAKDGKRVEPGLTLSDVTMRCEKGGSASWGGPLKFDHEMPVSGSSFSFHHEEDGYVFDVRGTFAKDGSATGTFLVHQPAPPAPAGVPGYQDPMGACDSGNVAFSASPQ